MGQRRLLAHESEFVVPPRPRSPSGVTSTSPSTAATAFTSRRGTATLRTLSYLGSGGALDGLLFAVRWAEHVWPLPLAPGSTSQIRFRFQSDAHEVDEGSISMTSPCAPRDDGDRGAGAERPARRDRRLGPSDREQRRVAGGARRSRHPQRTPLRPETGGSSASSGGRADAACTNSAGRP